MFTKNFVYDLFGRSPVRPLQAHMDKVQICVAELPAFFEAVCADDWQRAGAQQQKIALLEREADALKKELRLQLPKGMMLAMSRRDVLEVLTVQDRIANTAKDIAGLILGRKMRFPENLVPDLKHFLDRCIDAVRQAGRIVHELDELVETGFRGHEVDVVNEMLTELDKIEQDTDAIQRRVRETLFRQEADLFPVDVMFMYRIIDNIGGLADEAQRVGSRLQLMLAR
ncbi:TIGR00153 family protein [Thioalkalivibrio denitrificans]|uniref:TIGR00153 family protein n=1 Tax=Thioalkalivibrio denitrificans TaxID=108003 RepID=A0A1V3NP44_9GAMM|nr:TIGR00153 family protein [Thioalkalivibrio denitrificans]OOG26801.1 TIGR00153 family protein [Thioalkalivibrio denitrificans]